MKIDVPEELIVSTGLDETRTAEAGPAAETNAMAELLSLKAELASARSALERVTREKVTADQQSASDRGKLKASCEQAMESRRLAEERLAQAMRELQKIQARPPQPDSEELLRLREQLEQAAAATTAAEQARKTLQGELKGVRESVTRLDAENVLLKERLAAAGAQVTALQADAAAAKQLEEQLAAVRATANEATEKLAAMAGIERSLHETLQREEVQRRQAETVGNDLAATRKELEEMKQRLAKTEEALASVMNEAEVLRASSNMTEENRGRLAEVETELTAARERLKAAQAEIGQLSGERVQLGELKQRLAEAEEELAEARTDLQRREEMAATAAIAGDRPADEQLIRLAEEKAAVEAEYVRLANESRETEATLAESLTQAEAEIERLTSELEIQGQVAAMEQAALRAELRRMIVEGGAAFYTPPPSAEPLPAAQLVSPPSTAPAPPPAPALAPTHREETPPQDSDEDVDETPDAPIAGDPAILQEFASELGGFYGGGGASTTEFRMDPAIGTITCNDPADVVAVFFSSNTVQAMPDSKGIQRCKGYIVATKTGEGYQVYVAWYLTETGRVVVCLPEQQPSDSDDCVQILKDAVSYFEIVGFMMEIVDLGTTRHSYKRSLKKIPVLKMAPAA